MKWLVTLSVSMMIFLSGCGEKKEDKVAMSQKPELLFYVGITMVKPMTELAQRFSLPKGVV